MQQIKTKEKIPWPTGDYSENFEFSASGADGVFVFNFKWLNDQWNVWVQLPDGEVRQAAVLPGVISWSECTGYGLVFETSLTKIEYASLFLTELYVLKWV